MKLVYLLPLFIFSTVWADSDQLFLRGVVREQVAIEMNEGQVEVRHNSQYKNIPLRINRHPSSLAAYEQVEVVVP